MSTIAYFDNAATTFPKPEEVYRFMDSFYRKNGVNAGRGQYALASSAANMVNETRQLLLSLFHCPAKKVVFTHSATEALNIVLQGIPIRNGANVYISPFEHNAVTRVLEFLSSKNHINVIQLSVQKQTIVFDTDEISRQFKRHNPDVVIMSHASNTCGVIAPIEDICSLAKQYGAITLIDAAQTAGLIELDLNKEVYDFVVFAGHKTLYGPFGVAGFISSDRIQPLPLVYGGTGIDSANQSLPTSTPERYEVGSLNLQAIAGLNAALTWNRKVGLDTIYKVEQSNHSKLIELLSKYENINIIKPKGDCVGVVSCLFEGYSSDNIGNVLNKHNVAVRTGMHCSPFAHKFLGTFPSGTVRFSVSYFTNNSDFMILENALDYIEKNS